MSSLFGMLEMSKRGLAAGQMGVRIANHNISNMGSAGYARQRVELSPLSVVSDAFGRLGSGVRLDRIQRITDDFLARSLRSETTEQREWMEASDILGRIEIVTGVDEETSLTAAITGFFNAYGDLAQNTEDPALRRIVVDKAARMAEQFQGMSSDLGRIRDDIDQKMSSQINAANSLLSDVAHLNEEIIAAESGGQPANDLRTQRDQALTRLAGYVKISTTEDGNGGMDVFVNGKNVVHRATHLTMEDTLTPTPTGNTRTIEIADLSLSPDQLGGSIGAMAETRDKELDSVIGALDTLAQAIVSKVNGVHRQGMTAKGSNIDFFSGTSAADIDVAGLLQQDPSYVATSYSGKSGDNSLANDVVDLADGLLTELGGKSFAGYYSALVGDVGSVAEDAARMVLSKQLTTEQLTARLESVAGVSLDEELMNITRFQTAYEAAANLATTVTEMIDTILVMGARR